MDSTPEGLPPSLRFLKGLVIVLMITMIVGVITVVGLLVTRMPKPGGAARPVPETLVLPETITLPDGAAALAVTTGPGWYAVVTTDQRILIYDRATGTLRQQVAVTLPASQP